MLLNTLRVILEKKDAPTFVNGTLVFITIIAALGWIFSKESIAELPPLLFIAIRFLLSTMIILPFFWKSLRSLTLRQVAIGTGAGVGLSTILMLWITAISNSNRLGEGAFIVSIAMILVPLLGWLFFREPISRRTFQAIPITLAGLALLAFGASGLNWQFEARQLLFLLASLATATLFLYTGRFGRELPSQAFTVIQFIVVMLVSLLASTLYEPWPTSLMTISPGIWIWVGLSAVIATALRYFLLVWCQQRMVTGKAAVIMTLEPVWTALLSSWWLAEVMAPLQITGCALVLVALLIAQRR